MWIGTDLTPNKVGGLRSTTTTTAADIWPPWRRATPLMIMVISLFRSSLRHTFLRTRTNNSVEFDCLPKKAVDWCWPHPNDGPLVIYIYQFYPSSYCVYPRSLWGCSITLPCLKMLIKSTIVSSSLPSVTRIWGTGKHWWIIDGVLFPYLKSLR